MKSIPQLFFRTAAFLLLTLGVLSACVPQSPGPTPSRPGGMCTMENAPVCAQRGNQTRTFANGCIARNDGFRVLHNGECRRAEPQRACTMEYRPVCAIRGNRWQTFSNACLADADNFRVVHQGQCR